jgi:hypothetical protein
VATRGKKPKTLTPAQLAWIDALAEQDAAEFLQEETMAAKQPTKNKAKGETPARLKGVPRKVRPVWELSAHEREGFDRRFGVTRAFAQLHPRVHPGDREILFNGLAAAIAFFELSNLIDDIDREIEIDDLVGELRQIRVGFELCNQALDMALDGRGDLGPEELAALRTEMARAAAKAKTARDPKAAAMSQIREEWEKAGRPGASFARDIHTRYADVLVSEKSIENAIARWRKEQSSS